MKRILMMVFRNILVMPYIWFRLCYYAAHVDKYTEEQRYKMLKYIVGKANKGGNVAVEAHGRENIPQKNGFIFFPNHQGMYDMIAIMAACDVPISVVAKKELGNIQFLKQVFACMKAQIIDREDLRQSMRVIKKVSQEAAQGRNYVIFPEGTRSKNGNIAGDFKGGTFKAAMMAKCPIVPVALIDSFKPMDSKSTEKVTVKVYFMKPLFYEDYREMKTTDIALLLHDRIQQKILENAG